VTYISTIKCAVLRNAQRYPRRAIGASAVANNLQLVAKPMKTFFEEVNGTRNFR